MLRLSIFKEKTDIMPIIENLKIIQILLNTV